MTTTLKLVCVGDGAVGKTCLLIQFIEEHFKTEHIPTIFDNHAKVIKRGGKILNLSLWDTAGQEEYQRLRPLSYANTNIFIICFSLESRTSLKNVRQKWIPELINYQELHPSKSGKTPKFMLVGTKADLWEKIDKKSPDYISDAEITKMIKEERKYIKAFVSCSALTGEGVHAVFDQAVDLGLGILPKTPKANNSFCSIL